MTRDETKTVFKEIANLFPRFAVEGEDKTLKVNLWTEALEDMKYEEIHKSLIRYARTANKGFAPTAGQLIELTKEEPDPFLPPGHEYYPPEVYYV